MLELLLAATTLALSVLPTGFGLFGNGYDDPSLTTGAAFTPDKKTVYYAKSQPGYRGLTIFESHRTGNGWSAPEIAPFSGIFRDTDPSVTPDGSGVLFASARPPHGDGLYTYKIWIAHLTGPHAGSVEELPAAINGEGSDGHATMARDGTLYFGRTAGNLTRIYAAKPDGSGGYQQSTPIAFDDDTATVRDNDPAIAQDQRYLIFASNRPSAGGTNGLYLSLHQNDRWCRPVPLGPDVNTGAEFAPDLSPDGNDLYFASARTALVQPRDKPATAASFQDELKAYAHGTVRTYAVDIAVWAASQTCI